MPKVVPVARLASYETGGDSSTPRGSLGILQKARRTLYLALLPALVLALLPAPVLALLPALVLALLPALVLGLLPAHFLKGIAPGETLKSAKKAAARR